ncbi:unnamed protein product, partial [Allacma fusca]
MSDLPDFNCYSNRCCIVDRAF